MDKEEFVLCARYGETEEVQKALLAGIDPLSTDLNGNTALHVSAANGHLGIATDAQ